MCWKYFFEAVTLGSCVEGHRRSRGRASLAFDSAPLRSTVCDGERDQIGQGPQRLGGQSSLERDRLGLGEKSPVLHLVEQHAVLLEHLEHQDPGDVLDRGGRLAEIDPDLAWSLSVASDRQGHALHRGEHPGERVEIDLFARQALGAMQPLAHQASCQQVPQVHGDDHVILAVRERDRILEIVRDLRLLGALERPQPAAQVLAVGRERNAQDCGLERNEEGVAGRVGDLLAVQLVDVSPFGLRQVRQRNGSRSSRSRQRPTGHRNSTTKSSFDASM